MKREIQFLLLMAIVVLSGCAVQPNVSCTENESVDSVAKNAVSFVRFRIEPYSYLYESGIKEEKDYIAKNKDEWLVVWKEIFKNYYPPNIPLPDAPEIDFSDAIILVTAMGEKPTGGYSIFVKDIQNYGDRIEVTVHSVSPGPGCVTTQAVTRPVDITKIGKTVLPIVFKRTYEKHSCK